LTISGGIGPVLGNGATVQETFSLTASFTSANSQPGPGWLTWQGQRQDFAQGLESFWVFFVPPFFWGVLFLANCCILELEAAISTVLQQFGVQTYHFPWYLQHFGAQTFDVGWYFATRVHLGLVGLF